MLRKVHTRRTQDTHIAPDTTRVVKLVLRVGSLLLRAPVIQDIGPVHKFLSSSLKRMR
jgi:hypothetical protein